MKEVARFNAIEKRLRDYDYESLNVIFLKTATRWSYYNLGAVMATITIRNRGQVEIYRLDTYRVEGLF